MDEALWLQENDNKINPLIVQARDIIHTQRKTIEDVKQVATNVMQPLKRKEGESKASSTYLTSQLQDLDKT